LTGLKLDPDRVTAKGRYPKFIFIEAIWSLHKVIFPLDREVP